MTFGYYFLILGLVFSTKFMESLADMNIKNIFYATKFAAKGCSWREAFIVAFPKKQNIKGVQNNVAKKIKNNLGHTNNCKGFLFFVC